MEDRNIRKAGLKVTLPRIKILEIMENGDARHMSAEEVYKALLEQGSDIGLATVYRVLTQFESAHIVQRHHFADGHSVFELERGNHHDHLVCIRCGKVDEFQDDIVEAQQHKIANKYDYEITDHCFHLYGICASCRSDP